MVNAMLRAMMLVMLPLEGYGTWLEIGKTYTGQTRVSLVFVATHVAS